MGVMAELTARLEHGAAIPADSVPANARVDAAEFERVVCVHQKSVFRIILHIVRDPDQAASLTQDCFLRAYERLDTFRGESSLPTWLHRIAIHLALDHLKSRRARFWRGLLRRDSHDVAGSPTLAGSGVEESASPERRLLARETLDRVRRAVEQLSPQQRAVFALRFFEDYSLEEIREAMGIEIGTIKSHLFRAVRHVRRSMEDTHGKNIVRTTPSDR